VGGALRLERRPVRPGRFLQNRSAEVAVSAFREFPYPAPLKRRREMKLILPLAAFAGSLALFLTTFSSTALSYL
jgi:hypothetical protein